MPQPPAKKKKEKKKDPGLQKGNTGSQTLDYGLLPTGVDNWGGGGVGGIISNTTVSPPEWFFIKKGSGEARSNVSLTVRDKVTRQCLLSEEKGDRKRN